VNPQASGVPHDGEAEMALIGAILVSGSALEAVSEVLSPEDFYSERNRIIYSAALALQAEGVGIDQHTIADRLRPEGEFDKLGGKSYLLQILESVPTAHNAPQYARIVRDLSLRRQMIDAADTIRARAFEDEDAQAVVDHAEQIVYRAGDALAGVGGTLSPMMEIAGDGLRHIQDLYEAGGDLAGLSFGWPDVDDLTSGVQEGDLVILAARPAMGKTAFALGAQRHVATNEGVSVAMFSLEMDKRQINNRLLSLESSIPVSLLRSGRVPAEQWQNLVRATAIVGRMPIYIDDTPSSTVAQMRAKARRLQGRLRSRGERLGLIVVDYMQLMISDNQRRSAESRQQEVAEISRALKVMARDLGVVVLALSQLSRGVESRHDKRPLLSDLRDSGAIEQDADIVMFLYRDEYYDKKSERKGEAEVIVGKNRNGPTGTANLAWLERQAKFANLARGVVSYE
jgi:replicative DNA helicase